jgi:hypothetical protein
MTSMRSAGLILRKTQAHEQRIVEESECHFECAAKVDPVPVTARLVTRL